MQKMIQCGLGSREMLLIIPSLIYFEIEDFKKNERVHRNHNATALFREKCSFDGILIIFICKYPHFNAYVHSCFKIYFLLWM